MNTDFDKLLLNTAFCCMVSDGVIADEEISLIKDLCRTLPAFQNMDFDSEINRFVPEINTKGKKYIEEFLQTLETTDLPEQKEFDVIDIAIQVIKADNVIEYSEIKFFKTIRYRLKVSDEQILSYFSATVDDIDLFLGEDIHTDISLEKITQQYLDLAELPIFEMKTE